MKATMVTKDEMWLWGEIESNAEEVVGKVLHRLQAKFDAAQGALEKACRARDSYRSRVVDGSVPHLHVQSHTQFSFRFSMGPHGAVLTPLRAPPHPRPPNKRSSLSSTL